MEWGNDGLSMRGVRDGEGGGGVQKPRRRSYDSRDPRGNPECNFDLDACSSFQRCKLVRTQKEVCHHKLISHRPNHGAD